MKLLPFVFSMSAIGLGCAYIAVQTTAGLAFGIFIIASVFVAILETK